MLRLLEWGWDAVAISVSLLLLVVLVMIVAFLDDYEPAFLDSGDYRLSELDFQWAPL